ncbi:SDR family NAD(P)-dependent oxidoreductase [Cytobacillus firmus]|uniref:SDR family NAD(P)-dependent oxidoreductase n=1 Tax=Cytobacillus firmus TaxID=1399 RepID=UPI00203D8235|nr:SDR family NAD(P)-dependent oxidoreductase [Cytobacillus firmus]MCM3708092.1 SDR family NAD(P)-dependent oxidoreductase [Cytobacillus firmus]
MFFKNKKVLIIGGTGTIGRSLLTHILTEEPEVVVIVSRDEYKQHLLQSEMGSKSSKIRYFIGDIRNYDRMLNVMEDIDYVFHVAAMKHVTHCEENPFEAVLTNIIGTQNVIKAAKTQGVKKVVFSSSDKAIAPTNNYGATKLTAERLIHAAQQSKGSNKISFSSVRFGNVMGSRGSVIPLFLKQINENKKISITDPNMSRFMMTVEQATLMTIEAMKESIGGETFILKMPVVLIKDLAEVVIEEAANKYNMNVDEIAIEEIGLRPGEKKYEELMTFEESLKALELPNMFIVPSNSSDLSNYQKAIKAKPGTYQSSHQKPITKEVLRQLIQNQSLI